MTRSLAQIREDSRNALAGNYMLFFLVLIVTGFLTSLANQLISVLAWPFGGTGFVFLLIISLLLDFLIMILSRMFQAGHYFLSLNIARYNRVSFSDLFLAFRYDAQRALRVCIVLALVDTLCTAPFTVALSNLSHIGAFSIGYGKNVPVLTILLLLLGGIAGMIALKVAVSFPLSQALFLYIDHQDYSAAECFANSKSLMRGRIMEYFKLHLSLAGYFALCILSMGLGLIWVLPYLNVIRANYYMSLTGLYKPY